MTQLMIWIKKLAVVMILCSYMAQLLPAQYKRYFHLCTGLILILMMTDPLMRWMHADVGSEISYLMENLKLGSAPYRDDLEENETYRAYYIEQYRVALTEQIVALADASELNAEEVVVSMNEDTASENYGRLTALSMQIALKNGSEADSRTKNQFRQLLSQQLGLAESHIHLTDGRHGGL